MTAYLPKLNLMCLKNPSGRGVLVAESCVNCRNLEVLKAHAAAYDLTALGIKTFDQIKILTKERIKAEAARDALLKIAGLTTKDMEEEND